MWLKIYTHFRRDLLSQHGRLKPCNYLSPLRYVNTELIRTRRTHTINFWLNFSRTREEGRIISKPSDVVNTSFKACPHLRIYAALLMKNKWHMKAWEKLKLVAENIFLEICQFRACKREGKQTCNYIKRTITHLVVLT